MKRGALLLAAVLAACPAPAHGAEPFPTTREQALDRLSKGDVDARRHAAAALGTLGTMADAPALLRALRDSDQGVRARAETSMWSVWSRSGDPDVDALFQQGLQEMNHGDAQAAIDTFTTIIKRKPDFAEGWNKRATIYFMVGEYEKSLRDCDEVVKRNPQHWGVLSGYGQIYLALGQPERALDYFQRALAVNPNLERVEAAVEGLKHLIIEKRKGTI